MIVEGSALDTGSGAIGTGNLPSASLAVAPDMWHIAADTWVIADLLILIGFLLALLATFVLAVAHGRDYWKYASIFFSGGALSCGCSLVLVELELVHASGLPLFLLQSAAGLSAMIAVLTLWPALSSIGIARASGPDHSLEPALPFRSRPSGPLSVEDALRGTGASLFAHADDLSERWPDPLFARSGGTEAAAHSAPQFSTLLRDKVTAALRTAFARKEAIATDFQIEDSRGNPHWYELRIQPGEFVDGTRGAVGCLFDVTRFRKPEADYRALLQEATHRAKNLLTVIQSVVRLSAKTLNLPPAAIEPFNARLQSVALAYDLLVREEWEGVALPDLIRTQLNHALGSSTSRATWSGPPLRLRPGAVQTLALAFHELAIKAETQGALSTADGSLRIWWEATSLKDGTDGYRLVWQEAGVMPPEENTERKTFSRDILERLTPRGLRGEVSSAYTQEGFRWEVHFPTSNVLPPR